jgi:hypothetical protein
MVRATCLLVSVGAAGCDPVELTVLVNDSAMPIRVTLEEPHPRYEGGPPLPCAEHGYVEPRIQPVSSGRDAPWQEISGLQYDATKCQFVFALEPRFAAMLATAYRCEHTAGIAGLTIEAGGTRLEWQQAEALAQFKRHGGRCVYRYK